MNVVGGSGDDEIVVNMVVHPDPGFVVVNQLSCRQPVDDASSVVILEVPQPRQQRDGNRCVRRERRQLEESIAIVVPQGGDRDMYRLLRCGRLITAPEPRRQPPEPGQHRLPVTFDGRRGGYYRQRQSQPARDVEHRSQVLRHRRQPR